MVQSAGVIDSDSKPANNTKNKIHRQLIKLSALREQMSIDYGDGRSFDLQTSVF